MNFVIDIGNSFIKLSLFDKDIIVKNFVISVNSIDAINKTLIDYFDDYNIDNVLISNVRNKNIINMRLFPKNVNIIEFNVNTPIPLKIKYKSPGTLGTDRIAAAVGGASVFPGNNVLVIIAGTCITYELVNINQEYIGGAISPGMMMRFNALNNFTGNLPLINKPAENPPFIGKSTEESLSSGVVWGIVNEIDTNIQKYSELYPGIKVVFSGGDVFYFDKLLKSKIFATEFLVSQGLNKILLYNVHT